MSYTLSEKEVYGDIPFYDDVRRYIMPEKSIKTVLGEIQQDVTEIKTVLLGVKGTADKGLVGTVNKLFNGHIRLKITVYCLITFLTGAGILEWRDVINIFG